MAIYMIKHKLIGFLFLLSFIAFVPLLPVYAAETNIYDDVGYFSEDETALLEEEYASFKDETDIDIIVVTGAGLGLKTPDIYLEDYFDSLYDNHLTSLNTLILLYGEDSEGKYCEIQGYGMAEYYITNNRIDNILDAIIPDMSSGRLYDACITFSEISKKYILNSKQDTGLPSVTIAPIPIPSQNGGHIYDDGGYLTDSELSELEKIIIEYMDKAGIEIIIVTAYTLNGRPPSMYLNEYSDKLYRNGLIGSNAAIMLYTKSADNISHCQISGYGTAEYYISSIRIEKILDVVMPQIESGNLSKSFGLFAENVSAYMQKHPVHDQIYVKPWFLLIVAAVISAIIVFIMAASSGGRMTVGKNTYLDASHSGITASKDQYIRTSVTKRRRPQQQTSTGGGRSHSSGGRSSSGGGRSHSGGGRRF